VAEVNEAALEPLLRVRGLTAGYDGRAVVHDVELTVGDREIVVVLGSNGAGKTTTLRAITGLLRPFAATVTYRGAEWRTDRPWRAAEHGLAMVPSERFTFAALTVSENLALGANTVASPSERQEREQRVLELFPRLAERRDQKAGTMSGGEQRMLSVGIAMMARPRLLLLDEPSLGLAPTIVEQIMRTLRQLVEDDGLSVLMVEQNVGQAVAAADRVYVLRSGRIIIEEPAHEMAAREQWWDLF
jgi:branched-chain amino acid transport system ATP-binding protein